MQVRCLHCHELMDLKADSDLSDICCSSCGGSFSLVGSEKTTVARDPVRTLGRFELIQQVGLGSFGSVWKARDPQLDRTVAIKIPRKGQLDSAESEQFLREARAAAQLKHPHIVAVHEVGRDQDTVYIVSDFVQGATLDDWLTGQQLPPREAAQLCAKIADALDHAHRAGIIHRDLKPSNIMLDLDGVPHLMDFGLARRQRGDATVTVDGRIIGTPAYMSPELARGEAHYADCRSDVYSLGVILFRLLTGELPFRGNPQMLIVQILREEAPSPRKLDARIPRDLETIVLKCLQKSPDRRLPSAAELAAELRRFLSGEPIRARPIGRIERFARWSQRNPQVATLLTALAITIAAGFTGVSTQLLNARRNLAVAQAERERADRGFRKARQAVDQMLTDVGQHALKDVPGMAPVRQALLQKALNFYEDFLNERANNRTIQQETAEAFGRVASINELMGRNAEAEQAYQQAIDLVTQLGRDYPANDEHRVLLGDFLQGQGKLFYTTGRLDEAEKTWKHARATREDLTKKQPENADRQHALATTLNALGVLSKNLSRLNDAERYFSDSLRIWQALAKDHPHIAENQQYLAAALNNLGFLYSDLQRFDEAAELYKDAAQIQNKLVNDFPNVGEYSQHLSQTYHNLGWLYHNLAQYDQAEPNYQKGLEIRQRLVAKHPTVPKHQIDLAQTTTALGWLHQNTGRPDSALRDYQTARTIVDSLVTNYPDVLEYQVQMGRLNLSEGWLCQMMDRLADAQRCYDRASAIYLRLTELYPTVDEYRNSLGQVYHELGMLYGDKLKQVEQAKASYQRALEFRESLVDDRPDVPKYLNNLAWTYQSLGVLLRENDELTASESYYLKALSVREDLVQRVPLPMYSVGLAASYGTGADRRRERGELTDAMDMYDRAIEILKPLVGPDTPPPDTLETLQYAYAGRAQTFELLQRHPDAIPDWQQAIELVRMRLQAGDGQTTGHEQLQDLYYKLAASFRSCDRNEEAAETERLAAKLNPESPR